MTSVLPFIWLLLRVIWIQVWKRGEGRGNWEGGRRKERRKLGRKCNSKKNLTPFSLLVKLLVERGADVNAVDRFGATPLRDSFSARRAEIATYLRRHGAYLGDNTEGFEHSHTQYNNTTHKNTYKYNTQKQHTKTTHKNNTQKQHTKTTHKNNTQKQHIYLINFFPCRVVQELCDAAASGNLILLESVLENSHIKLNEKRGYLFVFIMIFSLLSFFLSFFLSLQHH